MNFIQDLDFELHLGDIRDPLKFFELGAEVSNNYLLIYCLIFLGKDFLEKINPVGTGGLNSWSQ